jgi:SAM-dependent methyltransferase
MPFFTRREVILPRETDPVEELYERFPYPPDGGGGKIWRRRQKRLLEEGERIAALLASQAPTVSEGTVLDAGCGTGTKTLGMARALDRARIVGLERSRASGTAARELWRREGAANATALEGDLENPADLAKLGPFDGIVCDGVLHHLLRPADTFQSLADRLAPGGAMYVTVFSRVGRPPQARLGEMVRIAGGKPDLDAALPLARSLLTLPSVAGERHGKYYEDDAFLADAFLHPREAHFDVCWLADRFEECNLRFVTWPEGEKHLHKLEAAVREGGVDPSGLPLPVRLHLVELWKAPALVGGLGVRDS